MKACNDLVGKLSGLYDSATEGSLLISKAVDITNRCSDRPENERVLLLYTQARRGRIVVIVDCYEGKNYGSSRHFFLDEIDKRILGKFVENDDLQECWNAQARSLGMSSEELLNIALGHAPPRGGK